MVRKTDTARMLTVEQILEAPDLREAIVEVPEWGGSVKVRGFTKKVELDIRKRSRIDDEVDRDRLEMLFIIEGMIEPKMTEEHIVLLAEKSSHAVDRVLRKIMELSGSGEEAVDKSKGTFPEGSTEAVPVPAGEGSA